MATTAVATVTSCKKVQSMQYLKHINNNRNYNYIQNMLLSLSQNNSSLPIISSLTKTFP